MRGDRAVSTETERIARDEFLAALAGARLWDQTEDFWCFMSEASYLSCDLPEKPADPESKTARKVRKRLLKQRKRLIRDSARHNAGF
jgi:hypothetical protein